MWKIQIEGLMFISGLLIGCLITYILSNLISRSKNKSILKDNINQFIQMEYIKFLITIKIVLIILIQMVM